MGGRDRIKSVRGQGTHGNTIHSHIDHLEARTRGDRIGSTPLWVTVVVPGRGDGTIQSRRGCKGISLQIKSGGH